MLRQILQDAARAFFPEMVEVAAVYRCRSKLCDIYQIRWCLQFLHRGVCRRSRSMGFAGCQQEARSFEFSRIWQAFCSPCSWSDCGPVPHLSFLVPSSFCYSYQVWTRRRLHDSCLPGDFERQHDECTVYRR